MTEPEVDRRQFLAATGAAAGAVVFSTQAADANPEPGGKPTVGVARSESIAEEVARLSVNNVEDIRLLQLTDIHFFCKAMLPKCDEQTIADLPRLVELAKPDLLLITGDLWHDNPEGKGAEYMRFGVEQISRLGVPWVFVWGNHDALDDYPAGHDFIANAKGSLYRGGVTGGHYLVELCDTSGKPVWELICLNSNERGDMVHAREWLTTSIASRAPLEERPPAFCLVHIPFRQYHDLWEAEEAFGIKLEGVAFWEEDGETLPLLRKAGNVRAAFCGHDHVNDYAGARDGIELVYGRATGTGGYGDNMLPKGAKLIRVNAAAGSYSWESIMPNGERWTVSQGMRIEDVEDVPWDVPSKRRRERRT